MAQHNELGKKGEKLAINFLIDSGYKILATNWRYKKDELDIIAEINNIVVIVEVKTRSTEIHGVPEDAVSKSKQKRILTAANVFIEKQAIDREVRFDIISIYFIGNNPQINHIIDAFGIFG